MPFDGVNFHVRQEPPRREPPSDDLLILAIATILYGSLMIPMALGGYVDVSRLTGGQTMASQVDPPRGAATQPPAQAAENAR